MPIIFLGMVILLDNLLHLKKMTFLLLRGADVLRLPSSVWSSLAMLFVGYLPSAIIVFLFVHFTHLRERLPSPVPGQILTFLGLVLIVLFNAALMFSRTIQGGGPTFVIQMFAVYFIPPAIVLILIGVVKALLATEPADRDGDE